MATHKPFKKALVTGGAGELSNEFCRHLVAMGTQIVALDISREGLDALAEKFGDKVSVDTYEADMRDHEGLETLLQEIAEKHPDIDVLFANAGIDIPQTAAKLDWRIANEHFDVNTTANYVLFSVFLPRFIERGEGHVVTIISLGGLVGTPYEHAYSGSKSAMHRIVDGLRSELQGKGVTFTSVFPGYLQGKMIANNAFNVQKATPMDVAGKRIVEAAISRKVHLKFPWFDAFKISVMGLLPRSLQDRLAAAEMEPDFGKVFEPQLDEYAE
jgi:short-subunit dehydrogenase